MAVMTLVLKRELELNAYRLQPETLQALQHAAHVAQAKGTTIASCAAAQAQLRGLCVPQASHPLLILADRCVALRRRTLEAERLRAERKFGWLELRGRLV